MKALAVGLWCSQLSYSKRIYKVWDKATLLLSWSRPCGWWFAAIPLTLLSSLYYTPRIASGMSALLLKHTLSGPLMMSASPIPSGKDLKLFQPKKNTVLVSHGRPPWYVCIHARSFCANTDPALGSQGTVRMAGKQVMHLWSVLLVQCQLSHAFWPCLLAATGGSASGKVGGRTWSNYCDLQYEICCVEPDTCCSWNRSGAWIYPHRYHSLASEMTMAMIVVDVLLNWLAG